MSTHSNSVITTSQYEKDLGDVLHYCVSDLLHYIFKENI